jgi:hypothetical protein
MVRRLKPESLVGRFALTVSLSLLFVGCEREQVSQPDAPTGCDPMDDALCGLPYPSDHYTVADDSTTTGLRVNFAESILPDNVDDVAFDQTLWNRRDGFSVGSALVTYFEDVSLDGVIELADVSTYSAADAKTVIINTVTGERVPHFVELDVSTDDLDEQLLMLRPIDRLEWGTRYVVGIQGLEKTSGGAVDVSTNFRAVRDGTLTQDGDVERRRDHYDDQIFPFLTADGLDKSDLQLAWDFTTASRDSSLGDMLWIRDDALAFIETGLEYAIDEVENGDCETSNSGRVVKGRIVDFPLYRTEDAGGRGLARDADGNPMRNGTTDVPWTLRIPCSVVENPGTSKLIQYGHGFFGGQGESGSGWLRDFIDANEYVLIASDWTGMEERDSTALAAAIAGNASNFSVLPEGSFQGFAEYIAVLRLARNELASDPATQIDVEGTLVPTISADNFGYYGISQGGILGGAYVGMSPDIERAVFGVTGGPYSFLTHRSADFSPFFTIFKAKYSDHREIALLIQHFQMLWDSGENVGWGYEMNRDVPAGYPAKQVLIQNALGDAQVSTSAGELQGRMYGVSTVAPQTRAIFGVEERTAPFSGSAIVEWAFSDIEDAPLTNTPPNADTDPHECVRRHPAAQEQVVHFLATGEVEQFCDGVCTDIQEGCR